MESEAVVETEAEASVETEASAESEAEYDWEAGWRQHTFPVIPRTSQHQEEEEEALGHHPWNLKSERVAGKSPTQRKVPRSFSKLETLPFSRQGAEGYNCGRCSGDR